ncbi:MAG: DUF481 domain-containing protein [Pseudomonadota bacterium]
MNILIISGAIASAMGANSMSGDNERGKENWDGTLEFSASTATGNTENSVLGAKFNARRVLGRYTHDIASGANYAETDVEADDGEDDRTVTQNNWFAQYRGELQTGDRSFAYVRGRYEEDEFSGFQSRAFLGVGLGHTAVERDTMQWDLLAGPGVQYVVLEPSEDEVMEDFEDEEITVALYAGSDFEWVMRENVSLEHELDLTWADRNSTISTEASLVTDLTETISTRLSYFIKHETDPPEGREDTDTLLRASVVYGF